MCIVSAMLSSDSSNVTTLAWLLYDWCLISAFLVWLPNHIYKYILKVFATRMQFGCHIDTAEQQRALNFELVVSDQLLSVI